MKKTLAQIRLKAAAPLRKMKTPPVFPKMGVPDDRKSVNIANTPRQMEIGSRAIANTGKIPYTFRPVAGSNAVLKPDIGFSLGSEARENLSGALLARLGFVTPPAFTHQSAPGSTALHERMHAIIGRAAGSNLKARETFAGNLIGAVRRYLPKEVSDSWEKFHSSRYNSDHPAYNEEKLTGMFNYLNSPAERNDFYSYKKMSPQQADEHHRHMNLAYRAIMRMAPHIDHSWTTPTPQHSQQLIDAAMPKKQEATQEAGFHEEATKKSEAFSKMAIKDLEPAQEEDDGSFDYGHMLPNELGGKVNLTIHNGDELVLAKLSDEHGNKIGHIQALKGEDKGVHYLEPHSEIDDQYRGLGLGKAMYEALYAHAYHNMGVREIRGYNHSLDAQRVHAALAKKHNLAYRPGKSPHKTLPVGPYQYSLDEQPVKKNTGGIDQMLVALQPAMQKVGQALGDGFLANPEGFISKVPHKLRPEVAAWVALDAVKNNKRLTNPQILDLFGKARPEFVKEVAKLASSNPVSSTITKYVLKSGSPGAAAAAVDGHPEPHVAMQTAFRNEKGASDQLIHRALSTPNAPLELLHPEDLKSYINNPKFVPDSAAAVDAIKRLSDGVDQTTISKLLSSKVIPPELAFERSKQDIAAGRGISLHSQFTPDQISELFHSAGQTLGDKLHRIGSSAQQFATHPNTPKDVLLSMLEPQQAKPFDPNSIDWNHFDQNKSLTHRNLLAPIKNIQDRAEQMKAAGTPDAQIAQFVKEESTKLHQNNTRYRYRSMPDGHEEVLAHLGRMSAANAPKTSRGLLNRLKVAEQLSQDAYQKERSEHARSMEQRQNQNAENPDHYMDSKHQEDALANRNLDRETVLRIIDARKASGRPPLLSGGFTNPNLEPQDIRDRAHYNTKEAEIQLQILDPDSHNSSIGYQRLKVPDVSTEKLRQLRDKVESMGGNVHQKLLPGLTPAVKTLLDNKGHLSSAKLQEAIDAMPGTDFWVGHGKGVIPKNLKVNQPGGEGMWHGKQRHSDAPSRVFHVNYTNDHVKKLKESGAWPTFAKIQKLIAGPNPYQPDEERHPLGITSIGWVRHTGDEDGTHVEEAQSDITQNRLPQLLARGGFYTPEGHLDAIRSVFAGQKKTGQDLLSEAFLHHMRQDPANHGKALHWPTMDIKADQTGESEPPLDTYSRLPKELGFVEGGKYGQLKTQSNPEFKDRDTFTSKLTKSEEEMIESIIAYLNEWSVA